MKLSRSPANRHHNKACCSYPLRNWMSVERFTIRQSPYILHYKRIEVSKGSANPEWCCQRGESGLKSCLKLLFGVATKCNLDQVSKRLNNLTNMQMILFVSSYVIRESLEETRVTLMLNKLSDHYGKIGKVI